MEILGMLLGRRGAGYSRLVDRYREYRRIVWKLNNEVLPEYLSRPTLDTAGKKLGMLRRNAVVMDHEDELGLWMDYAIHDVWERGGNAVSRYRANVPPDPRSDRYTVVKAMSESFYTLVRVVEVLRKVGVRVFDLWADREYLLIDMGFSQSAREAWCWRQGFSPLRSSSRLPVRPCPWTARRCGRFKILFCQGIRSRRRASVRWPGAGRRPPISRPPSSACAWKGAPRIGFSTRPSPRGRRTCPGTKG